LLLGQRIAALIFWRLMASPYLGKTLDGDFRYESGAIYLVRRGP